jgi:hypothetical protein
MKQEDHPYSGNKLHLARNPVPMEGTFGCLQSAQHRHVIPGVLGVPPFFSCSSFLLFLLSLLLIAGSLEEGVGRTGFPGTQKLWVSAGPQDPTTIQS